MSMSKSSLSRRFDSWFSSSIGRGAGCSSYVPIAPAFVTTKSASARALVQSLAVFFGFMLPPSCHATDDEPTGPYPCWVREFRFALARPRDSWYCCMQQMAKNRPGAADVSSEHDLINPDPNPDAVASRV